LNNDIWLEGEHPWHCVWQEARQQISSFLVHDKDVMKPFCL